MLVLFDVDKTLFLSSDPLMGQATTDAIETVWGLKVPGDAIRSVNHAGQTATRIAREILRLEGLSDEEIDPSLARWCEEASARYLELLDGCRHLRLASSRGHGRSALADPAQGAPHRKPRARCQGADGADRPRGFFPPGQGAFGCDAEERAELIDIAREASRRLATRTHRRSGRHGRRRRRRPRGRDPRHRLRPGSGSRRGRRRHRADGRAARRRWSASAP